MPGYASYWQKRPCFLCINQPAFGNGLVHYLLRDTDICNNQFTHMQGTGESHLADLREGK